MFHTRGATLDLRGPQGPLGAPRCPGGPNFFFSNFVKSAKKFIFYDIEVRGTQGAPKTQIAHDKENALHSLYWILFICDSGPLQY